VLRLFRGATVSRFVVCSSYRCKSQFEATRLLQALRRAGVRDVASSEREADTSADVLVAPIYAVRRMEFHAVILPNASKTNYGPTPPHNRLLYLGITRAAHRLHVDWFDQLAPLLESQAKPAGKKAGRPAAVAPRARTAGNRVRARPDSADVPTTARRAA
jgi:DNA helicase-2/ATP-dependent DNA helicase PcrA